MFKKIIFRNNLNFQWWNSVGLIRLTRTNQEQRELQTKEFLRKKKVGDFPMFEQLFKEGINFLLIDLVWVEI